MDEMICRICSSTNLKVFADLGVTPLANSLLSEDELDREQVFYPLRPMVCEECNLVQLPEVARPDQIFSDYPYFSSQSQTFVEYAAAYALEVIHRFKLTQGSLIVEIASNDGYLLQHFVKRGYRCYGVEPARNVAEHAIKRGVPTLSEFFDATLVCDRLLERDGDLIVGGQADLIVANNVLAHVPNLHGFVQGLRMLLKRDGVLTIEVPWLVDLVDKDEVGTIYHEHFSYFLLSTLELLFSYTAAPLRVFDVERLEVHGGSLRVYVCHQGAAHEEESSVSETRMREAYWLVDDPLHCFASHLPEMKREVWSFLLSSGKTVGYAAAAKAATVLSYTGVGPDVLSYIADTTPAKQGKYLGGTRIPVVSPEMMAEDQPETIWILAPNWLDEILPKLREQCPNSRIAWLDGTVMRIDVQ